MSSSKKRREGNFVFSTQFGELCGDCDKPVAQCLCGTSIAPAEGGVVRVRRETAGRKGKGVTLVEGVPLAGAELKTLAKFLKARCATGGKVGNGVIELQGEHRDRVLELLADRGWRLKKG